MPLPIKYREPVKDFFAGKITSKELRETIERIDDMQRSTGKISGRDVELTLKEVYASLRALSSIMYKEFDEQSAYRIGRLKNKLEAVHKDAEKEKGNITIPQPGLDKSFKAFFRRVKSEEFQKDIAELLQTKCTLNVPPINLPAGFTITPADRMALAWLLGDEDND